jgi:hypothetical protein
MANTVAAELLIDGVYTAKTAFIEESITATVGPDPDSGTAPSKVELTFDNTDLSMDPSNALSALYGKIGRNTRFRLQVDSAQLVNAEATEWTPDTSLSHSVSLDRVHRDGRARPDQESVERAAALTHVHRDQPVSDAARLLDG